MHMVDFENRKLIAYLPSSLSLRSREAKGRSSSLRVLLTALLDRP